MQFNWIDWVIFIILLYYLLQGWEAGLIQLIASLLSFLGSLWFAIKFHAPVGLFLVEKFGVGAMWSNVLGYLIVGFTVDIILTELLGFLITFLPKKLEASYANRTFGIVLSGINGIIVTSFILLVILSLPIGGTIKRDIRQSLLGKRLVMVAERYGGQVKSALDEQIRERL